MLPRAAPRDRERERGLRISVWAVWLWKYLLLLFARLGFIKCSHCGPNEQRDRSRALKPFTNDLIMQRAGWICFSYCFSYPSSVVSSSSLHSLNLFSAAAVEKCWKKFVCKLLLTVAKSLSICINRQYFVCFATLSQLLFRQVGSTAMPTVLITS